MAVLEGLRQEVRDISSAVDSGIVLIQGLANRLREALMQPDLQGEIDSLASELDASAAKFAAAIAANTVAEDDGSDESDHGPIDDSATAPADGEPTTDETQTPEGGEPAEEAAVESDADSGASADDVVPESGEGGEDSQPSSDESTPE